VRPAPTAARVGHAHNLPNTAPLDHGNSPRRASAARPPSRQPFPTWSGCPGFRSESGFKTLKFQPDYPGHFVGSEHARAFVRRFVPWYNEQHRHDGLNGFPSRS
jgi:hypothetical protein